MLLQHKIEVRTEPSAPASVLRSTLLGMLANHQKSTLPNIYTRQRRWIRRSSQINESTESQTRISRMDWTTGSNDQDGSVDATQASTQ
jgi:hypothetical protein